MSDPYNLQRFIDAQQDVFETAIAELRAGSKQSHWMWFIFPQLAGLANYTGVDPTIVRLGLVALTLLTGPVMIFFYVLTGLLAPHQ